MNKKGDWKWSGDKWLLRTRGLPSVIQSIKKFVITYDGAIVDLVEFKAELFSGETMIWKVGEVFNNQYFTIKHYKGNLDKYQDTNHYLTANDLAKPTVEVKKGKTI